MLDVIDANIINPDFCANGTGVVGRIYPATDNNIIHGNP